MDNKIVKAAIALIFLVSLMAFGGRAALIFSGMGLLVLACAAIRKRAASNHMNLLYSLVITATTIAAPLCLAAIAYLALKTGIGERIATSAFWDSSADSRRLAFSVFHYMTGEEILFGASAERIMDIIYRMSLKMPLVNIENPWIMMFMNLGLILFPFWLAATIAFIYRLVKNQPLALQMAAFAYFIIASTSNSFGHKDAGYAIMVSAVVCATGMLKKTGNYK